MTEPESIMITKEVLQVALWQAWYHCQLEELDLQVIDGNDHLRLLKLTDDLWERIKDELPFEEEGENAKH